MEDIKSGELQQSEALFIDILRSRTRLGRQTTQFKAIGPHIAAKSRVGEYPRTIGLVFCQLKLISLANPSSAVDRDLSAALWSAVVSDLTQPHEQRSEMMLVFYRVVSME